MPTVTPNTQARTFNTSYNGHNGLPKFEKAAAIALAIIAALGVLSDLIHYFFYSKDSDDNSVTKGNVVMLDVEISQTGKVTAYRCSHLFDFKGNGKILMKRCLEGKYRPVTDLKKVQIVDEKGYCEVIQDRGNKYQYYTIKITDGDPKKPGRVFCRSKETQEWYEQCAQIQDKWFQHQDSDKDYVSNGLLNTLVGDFEQNLPQRPYQYFTVSFLNHSANKK